MARQRRVVCVAAAGCGGVAARARLALRTLLAVRVFVAVGLAAAEVGGQEEGGGVFIGAVPVQPRLQAFRLQLVGAGTRLHDRELADVGGGVKGVASCGG